MHKLNVITGAAIGVTLALALIGYVDGIVHRDEMLAVIGALAAGAWAWDKFEG